MPLQKQIITFPFSAGIDTKTTENLVQPPSLLELENGVFDKTGAIRKRYGYDALPKAILGSASSIDGCDYLTTLNDELLLVNNNTLYTYSEALEKWISKGIIPACKTTIEQVVKTDVYSQTKPDAAKLGNFLITVWQDSRSTNSIRYSVLDIQSGNYVVSDSSVATTGFAPKIVTIGNNAVIMYRNSTSLRTKVIELDSITELSSENTISGLTLQATDGGVFISDYLYGFASYDSSVAVIYFYGTYTPTTTGNKAYLGFMLANGQIASPGDGYVLPTYKSSTAPVSQGLISDGTSVYYVVSSESETPLIDFYKVNSSLVTTASLDISNYAYLYRFTLSIDSTDTYVYITSSDINETSRITKVDTALASASIVTVLTAIVANSNSS